MYIRVHFYLFFKGDSFFFFTGLKVQVGWDESGMAKGTSGEKSEPKGGQELTFVGSTYRESHQKDVRKLYPTFIAEKC